ncbi:MAG TPA: DUF1015 family protein [Candidatus Polarisedimenticolaceae bacterium]|nr:DUF1015 family protein [Candidatus Polarisedimenticolaceae bacterium]
MQLLPFRAVRPAPDLAARIPSLPYDVLDTAEARAIASGDPYSFLHVVKPEIDLPDDVPHDDARVYAGGRAAFDAMLARGWMRMDPAPALYVYRLTRQGRTQTGVVGLARVEDYERGRILRHELTRAAKELDRVRHTRTLGAQPGLVFLACRPAPPLAEALAAVAETSAPASDFVAADGVRHTVWVVPEGGGRSGVEAGLSALDAFYIADGHHRAAAYARVAREAPGTAAPAFVAAVFPGDELTLLDYNRVVRDLGGRTPEAFLDAVAAAGFRVTPSHAPVGPQRAGVFGMFLGGRWFRLDCVRPPGPEGDPVAALDVSVLSERLLGPVLGIADVRTDPRIDFVGGGRGIEELARRVTSGEAAVAFSLCATRLDDVFRVADSGGIMPPKSTWFEPKLRSGLLVHVFQPRA